MAAHQLHFEQLLPMTIKQVWSFFSSPGNLAKITPPDLDFKIITLESGKRMYEGMEIEYTVKPLLGLPVRWRTLITDVNEPFHFADKQIKGPYSVWEHSHTFTEMEGGVLMIDDLKYQLPLGVFGEMAHSLFVKKRIETIFNYRRNTLNKMFIKQNELVN